MALFVDLVYQWEPKDAGRKSFGDALILDAHEWGEARVRAELSALQMQGETAETRRKRLSSLGQSWYTTGYRMYLVTENTDMPDVLRDQTLRTSAALKALSASVRHGMAQDAGRVWWDEHASTICDKASAEAAAESRKNAVTAPAPVAPVAPVASSPSPSPSTPATATPITSTNRSAPRKPTHPKLPKTLAALLESPAEKRPNNPRQSVEETVTAAFDAQRAMRVWDDPDFKSEGRAFSLLSTPAHCTQARLKSRDLGTIYGREEQAKGDAALQRIGMRKVGGGGYNTVWKASDKPDELKLDGLRDAFPERHVVDRFVEGALVLRVPHERTPWIRFETAVGEASNMLFNALCGIGPKVALLSYARRKMDDPNADEEGVQVCVYKIFAFLERATVSVDQRYSLEVMPFASATGSRAYYNALLVCVFRFSWQGYVHLDGTLRNFVDLYPARLPTTLAAWRINVIDVERKHFRRLCPTASTDWRDLFLVNLLVALTFLKIELGFRWDQEVDLYWSKAMRDAAEHLIRDLRGRATLPAITHWQGGFVPDEKVPELANPPFVGDTHEVASRCLSHQMRYYLLNQPVEQCTKRYVEKLASGKATAKAIEVGGAWYEGVYRPTFYPTHCYFRECHGDLLVFALFQFLETPHAELQARFGKRLPPLKEHRRGVAPEVLLGV